MNPVRSILSWNICGTRKLARYPLIISWLASFSILLFQETLELNSGFNLNGYAKFEVPARATNGRPSGGLATFISTETHGNFLVEVLHSTTWFLFVRIFWEGLTEGLLIGNVYIERLV